METLKSKLKVVWAVAAAVVILLGGLAAKDALARCGTYVGYSDKNCVTWRVTAATMEDLVDLANAGSVKTFKVNGGPCMNISPAG